MQLLVAVHNVYHARWPELDELIVIISSGKVSSQYNISLSLNCCDYLYCYDIIQSMLIINIEFVHSEYQISETRYSECQITPIRHTRNNIIVRYYCNCYSSNHIIWLSTDILTHNTISTKQSHENNVHAECYQSNDSCVHHRTHI